MSVHMNIDQKTGLFMSLLSTSLKVIRTDVDQSGTCDFLLMFIATMDLSCNTISMTERDTGWRLHILL